MKNILVFILLLIVFSFSYSQENEELKFVRYYYPTGQVSSEGYLRNGIPDGYWRNYYEDGTLKSEGNRNFHKLDSIWKFYYPDGNLQSEIFYRNDLKNGYQLNYEFYYDKDSNKVYYLASKELFLNGKREGKSYYFDIKGNLRLEINFKNDKRHGEGREYDESGTVITLLNFFNGYEIENIRINRKDNEGRKQGKWMEFYENGNKKREMGYLNDKFHGFYREYDNAGKILLERRYIDGEIFVALQEQEINLKAEVKKVFYPNGVLQYEGAFIENVPVGIHKEYDEKGKLIKVSEYDSEGLLRGEGLFDAQGLRTGKWRLFDPYNEYYYAEGEYEKGLRTGKWIFYFPDGSIEMEGYFEQDKPEKEWTWYFPNGNIRREEVYFMGKREGPFKEFDIDGNLILKGEYFDGERNGDWEINVGDVTQKGKFNYGEKEGEWQFVFNDNGKLRFIGNFKKDEPDGMHKFYYPNGNIEIFGAYRMGKKHKDWKKFDESGKLLVTYTYKNDVLIKIDGVNIRRGKAGKK
ncbi:MAG: hypothetical protein LDL38_01335 [Flavobacterium piscis]|nr:hypothetical protein [Flavobacterium piscis]